MTSSSRQDESDRWNILYRGSLSSCNYDCSYCPFAKTTNTLEELKADYAALERFVEWVRSRTDRRVGILFTPWGEALVRKPYQRAVVELSNMAHVERVAVQTNLSYRTGWLDEVDRDTAALWTTYHPTQVSRERFLASCHELIALDVRFSVGMVGLREDFDEIEQLRAELPPEIYLWVNAYKREARYYKAKDIARLRTVDPEFTTNLVRHQSLGRECRAGDSSFTVDHNGTVRRCHFIDTPIGNIFDPNFDDALRPTPCSNDTCGCHIGYIHMPELELYELYGEGLLERIPAS